MKRISVIILALFAINSLSQAQNLFSKIYESPKWVYAFDVCETFDKGYIIAGQIWTTQNHNDIYVVKTDQIGDTLWTKSIGGIGNEYGYSIKQTNDRGYIIVGQTTPYEKDSNDIYVVKISENGEVIWTKTFGGTDSDNGVSIELTDDNGYLILGRTTSFGFDMGNPYLIRLNAIGDTIWTKTPSCESPGCSVFDFCITSDGGYLIAGNTFSYNEGEWGHVFLLKTDSNGDKVWSKIYTNYMENVGVSVKESPDGGYIIVGPSYRNLSVPYTSGIVQTKTDHSGNVLWSKAFNKWGETYGYSVDKTIDSGYIISGKAVNPNNYNGNVYLIKTNSVGDTRWTKLYDSLRYGFGEIVKQTSDSGYIVTGQIEYSNTPSKIFLLKTDKDGNTSGLSSILSGKNSIDFKVYPNPVSDILTIQRDENSKVWIEIIDVHGRIIYQKEDSDNLIRIDISKYPTGPYILKILSDSKVASKLILKSKSH